MKLIKNILLAASVAICVSCSDFLEEYSQDLKKVESWSDLDELLLGDGYFDSGRIYVANYTVYTEGELDNIACIHFMGDEMEAGTDYPYQKGLGNRKTMYPFYTWQKDTGVDEEEKFVGSDSRYWDDLYKRINVTNMVIAVIDGQPEADEEDRLGKERVKGEAHFLRAACYFLLANLYGKPYVPATAASTPGVPVKTSEIIEDKEYTRNTLAEVYKQILDDLGEAEKYLSGKTRKSIYHANLTAVYLLKSRVYLYMQDWEHAAEYARKTLGEQDDLLFLALLTKGENALYKSSPETIFSMGGYMVAYNFEDGKWYEPAFYLSDDMVSLFHENDWRSEHYIGEGDYGHKPVFLKVHGQNSDYGKFGEVSDCFLLRTPEAYLTLAEASVMLGEEEEARKTLKAFLGSRMKTSVEVTETGGELMNLIRDERAREFLLEGHRWFDLRRYTVYETYPFSKTIEHGYTFYDTYNSCSDYTNYYMLEKDDPAYTLPIPRDIRSFQVSIGNNERPERKPCRVVKY